jgi:ATP-dependent DNA ligase
MECLPVSRLPEGPDWVYELKLDGYRLQPISDDRSVRLLSRRGNDFTPRYPSVADALRSSLEPGNALDGEIVALDSEGRPSFNVLQNARPDTPVVFYAFDILTHRWKDLKRLLCPSGFRFCLRPSHLQTGYSSVRTTAAQRINL